MIHEFKGTSKYGGKVHVEVRDSGVCIWLPKEGGTDRILDMNEARRLRDFLSMRIDGEYVDPDAELVKEINLIRAQQVGLSTTPDIIAAVREYDAKGGES